MSAGQLDRVLQFQRLVPTDDGFTSGAGVYQNWGGTVRASRNDISDGERMRAGEVGATITTRFQVRSSEFTRGITPADRLICQGRDYNITGIKEVGRMHYLEITAAARAD